MRTFEEDLAILAEKKLVHSGRTLGGTLAVLGLYCVLPAAFLVNFWWTFLGSGVNYESATFLFVCGIVYFLVVWHLMPTQYWEILIYAIVISIATVLIYLVSNNVNLKNGGTRVSLLFYSPWIQLAPLSVLFFPIKFGFDADVKAHPLEEREEGYYSQNFVIRYLQIHHDLPSFRPRAILLGIFSVLYGILIAFYGMWNWLADIRI